MIKNFNELLKMLKVLNIAKCAVVAAEDHSIEAALEAEKDNMISPIFIGDKKKIEEILKEKKAEKNYEIIEAASLEEAAAIGVSLVKNDEAELILKGGIDTSILLKEVVNKERGISVGRVMSHIAMIEDSNYHKLFCITDGGMFIEPDVDQKVAILKNSIELLKKLGYSDIKVSALCAVEKVNPKMKETIDAAELKKRNQNNSIKDCIVEGPISFDLAFSKEAAMIKAFNSPVCGDTDIMLVPSIAVGNILTKGLIYGANAKMAGVIYGAKVPIVLTSRSSTSMEKYLSIALALLARDK